MDDTGVVLIVFWVVAVNPLVGYAIGERKGNVATGIILGLLLGPVNRLACYGDVFLAIFGNAHFARKISSRMQKFAATADATCRLQ